MTKFKRPTKNDIRNIFLSNGFVVKGNDLKDYVFDAADALIDACRELNKPAPLYDQVLNAAWLWTLRRIAVGFNTQNQSDVVITTIRADSKRCRLLAWLIRQRPGFGSITNSRICSDAKKFKIVMI